MSEQEITDKSLPRCTVKKSASVLAKLILYASYVVVGLTMAFFAFYGLVGVWAVLYPVLVVIYVILLGIPWYYYAGAATLAAIPAYSLLWCVARELTEEDWKSNATDGAASAFMILGGLAISASSLIPAFASPTYNTGVIDHIILLRIVVGAFGATMILAGSIEDFRGSKLGIVGAAYHHYKNKKKPEQVT